MARHQSDALPRRKRLGEHLTEMGVLTPEQLERAAVLQAELATQGKDHRLGEVLIVMGRATSGQIAKALERQKSAER